MLNPQFRLLQKNHHQAVEGVDFLGVQIILSDNHILLTDSCAFPTGQCHVRLVRIGPIDNQFGGGVPRGGVEQFVLRFSKENARFLFPHAVVRTEGKKVSYLLIEALFRGANVADALQQFIEIIPTAGIFQAFVVHHEAFDQKLF